MSGADKCPVDHAAPPPAKCPVDHSTPEASSSRSIWSNFLPSSWSISTSAPISSVSPDNIPSATSPPPGLSTTRVISSIPSGSTAEDRGNGNWVYPSEAQFFAAMARKNHNPVATDMRTIVPIHNAVNERAWTEVMKWETGRGGETCGGVRLVNFKGKPGERSIRARWKMLLGYAAPFDRHDWVVDRCGTRVRYIIDFYSGRAPASSTQGGKQAMPLPSFFLDVRPALDDWNGVQMRVEHFWGGIFNKITSTRPNTPPSLAKEQP